MKQALSELISVILQRLEEHPEAAPSESGMRKWLAGQGYAKRDIDAAMRRESQRHEFETARIVVDDQDACELRHVASPAARAN